MAHRFGVVVVVVVVIAATLVTRPVIYLMFEHHKSPSSQMAHLRFLCKCVRPTNISVK